MERKDSILGLGGIDNPLDFLPDSVSYCDKINHFLRSLANQPNHKRVVKKIVGPLVNGENQVSGVTIETYRENKRRMKKF